MHQAMRIDIYSDTICPWCYLGKRRFELALAARPQYEPRIIWRPFELNPELPSEGVDRAGYLAAKLGDLAQIDEAHAALVKHGEAVGLQFRFDLIQRLPNTRRSHLLIAHAARHDLSTEVSERVMQAYFEEGCNIGDVEELVRIGVEAGLSERETRAAVILREGQDGVVAAERHAAVLGITGVPTFIFDRQYSVSGAQEVDDLHADHRPGRGSRRGPRNRFVTPAELTGRARTHIVDVADPACALHEHAAAPFLNLRRAASAERLRSRRGEQLPRFRAAARDLEREIRRRVAALRCVRNAARCRRGSRRRSASMPFCCGPRCRARAATIGAPMWISSIAARCRRDIGCN